MITIACCAFALFTGGFIFVLGWVIFRLGICPLIGLFLAIFGAILLVLGCLSLLNSV